MGRNGPRITRSSVSRHRNGQKGRAWGNDGCAFTAVALLGGLVGLGATTGYGLVALITSLV